MKGNNLNTILLIAVAVLLTLQVSSWFRGGNKMNDYYKEKIADKDKQIDDVKKELVDARRWKDSITDLLMKRDTVLVTKLISNDKKQQNIITVVRDASKDELRRFVTDY
jgi:hypothetical protein